MEELLGLTEPTWLYPWLLSAEGEAVRYRTCHVYRSRFVRWMCPPTHNMRTCNCRAWPPARRRRPERRRDGAPVCYRSNTDNKLAERLDHAGLPEAFWQCAGTSCSSSAW